MFKQNPHLDELNADVDDDDDNDARSWWSYASDAAAADVLIRNGMHEMFQKVDLTYYRKMHNRKSNNANGICLINHTRKRLNACGYFL